MSRRLEAGLVAAVSIWFVVWPPMTWSSLGPGAMFAAGPWIGWLPFACVGLLLAGLGWLGRDGADAIGWLWAAIALPFGVLYLLAGAAADEPRVAFESLALLSGAWLVAVGALVLVRQVARLLAPGRRAG